MVRRGDPFLFCDNVQLPFPDVSVDRVVTNGVPLNIVTWLGPGIQESEIRRVLRIGGTWTHDGAVAFTKP